MKRAAFAVAAICILASFNSSAGNRRSDEVQIILNQASGSLGSARNSTDTKQIIGCQLSSDPGVVGLTAICYATNASGYPVSCTTNDPQIIEVIKTINPQSYLLFTWDKSNKCDRVWVDNGSYIQPPKP